MYSYQDSLAKKHIDKGGQVGILAGFIIIYIAFMVLLWLEDSLFAGKIQYINFFRPVMAPWYVLAMVIWLILLPIFVKLKKKRAIILALLITFVLPIHPGLDEYLTLNRVIGFLPFFVVGYYFDKEKVDIIKRSKIKIIIGVVAMLVILGCWKGIRKYVIWEMYGGGSYEKDLEGLCATLLWLLIASLMTLLVMAFCPSKEMGFTYVGSGTLSVYVMHRLIARAMEHMGFNGNIKNEIVALSVSVVVSTVVTLVFSCKVFSNFFNKAFSIVKE